MFHQICTVRWKRTRISGHRKPMPTHSDLVRSRWPTQMTTSRCGHISLRSLVETSSGMMRLRAFFPTDRSTDIIPKTLSARSWTERPKGEKGETDGEGDVAVQPEGGVGVLLVIHRGGGHRRIRWGRPHRRRHRSARSPFLFLLIRKLFSSATSLGTSLSLSLDAAFVSDYLVGWSNYGVPS